MPFQPKSTETELDYIQARQDHEIEMALRAEEALADRLGPLSRYADYEFMDEYPMIQNVLD